LSNNIEPCSGNGSMNLESPTEYCFWHKIKIGFSV
jgi:hypothetical protein